MHSSSPLRSVTDNESAALPSLSPTARPTWFPKIPVDCIPARTKKSTLPELSVPFGLSAAEESDHSRLSQGACQAKCYRTFYSGLASEARRARFCKEGIAREYGLR